MASQAFRTKIQKRKHPANKLITANTTKCSKSIKKQPPNKSEKPSERKHSRCTLIKEEIQRNLKNCLMLTKFSPIQRKGSCMMIMDNKESKTEDLQEAQVSEDCLISSQEVVEENKLVLEKENQNS